MDEIRKQVAQHGRARTRARAKAREESAAIAELAPRAIEAGMSKVEFCKLAQITRPALDKMLADHG